MTQQRTTSVDSLCSILSCTSEDFFKVYEGGFTTDQLVSDVRENVLDKHRDFLDSEIKPSKYSVYKLLSAMLQYAPQESGKRYAAVVLQIAGTKGRRLVIDVAEARLDHMFLPIKAAPSSSQTPTLNDTGEHFNSANPAEQSALRQQLRIRENYRCSITGTHDRAYVVSLELRGLDTPSGLRNTLEAAHIIPLLLNNFDEKKELLNAARSWDMLRSWTSVDFEKLVGPSINTPSNAILMTADEHRHFGQFQFYLDKDAYPNNPLKYRAVGCRDRYSFTNGAKAMDVEFRTESESGFKPPNSNFLRVHAAFARVLYMSGAADYFYKIEQDAERIGALRGDGESDVGLLLTSKLLIRAY